GRQFPPSSLAGLTGQVQYWLRRSGRRMTNSMQRHKNRQAFAAAGFFFAAVFFLAAGFFAAAFLGAAFFLPLAPALAATSASASSNVMSSGVLPLGRVALVLPCFT